MGQRELKGGNLTRSAGLVRLFIGLPRVLDGLLHIVHHERGQADQVGVVVKHLVEKVAAVVGGELGVPDEALDILGGDGLDGILTVVHAVLGLKVDRVAGQLLAKEEDNFFLVQQLADIQHLEMGAEGLPALVVEVDMVLTADVLAGADIVV